MDKNLKENLELFYVLTETEQQATLMHVLELANSNPERFQQAIYHEEFNNLNYLPIIYEALAKDLTNWADFFLSELIRLLEIAKKSKTPKNILNHFDELSFIDPKNFQHTEKFIDTLNKELDNSHPTFRFYAISLLPDFIEKDNTFIINRMKRHLTDPDWRIRYWTYLYLQDLDAIGKSEKLSLVDKIRAKLFDTLNFE